MSLTYWHRLLIFIAIAVLLFGSQATIAESLLLDINQPVKMNQKSEVNNQVYWLDLAENAWLYFLPDAGVDSLTGLHNSELNHRGFTDWDLGVYIQAIVDAAKLGIIENETLWGFDYRIDKVLSFLENRPLSDNGTPYVWYSSVTGQNTTNEVQIAADAGNLFTALNEVKQYRPIFSSRIDNIVYNVTNYEKLRQAVGTLSRSVNIYDYYVSASFATFWPDQFIEETNTILSNITNSSTITYEGVELPKAKLMCEPLLLAIFNLGYNRDLMDLARTVYLAHEAYYNSTGNFVAFSEGNPRGVANCYIWEWVIIPSGETWVIQKDENTEIDTTPVVFLKAAVGLYGLFETQFTQNMVNDLIGDLSTNTGFLEGKSETGQVVSSLSDKTNSMIISTARYNIEKTYTTTIDTNQTTITTTAPSPSNPIITENTLKPNATIAQTPQPTTNEPTTTPSPTIPELTTTTITLLAIATTIGTIIGLKKNQRKTNKLKLMVGRAGLGPATFGS
ncbi:MAG: DUF3131 domain-containing protein [Crenarchaeota archaeon]|nr:DUF3131 domain-containing protein [Thermoproteota archaeon]